MTRKPTLIAIGGLSGSGKSTLARALAAERSARLLRSDVARKSLFGVAETTRLAPDAYRPEITETVYQQLIAHAAAALAGRADVIVDAVFQRPAERAAFETAAANGKATFIGLWLDTDVATRRARVADRSADASDATPAIVDQQDTRDPGPITWHRIAASGTAEAVLSAARTLIAETESSGSASDLC